MLERLPVRMPRAAACASGLKLHTCQSERHFAQLTLVSFHADLGTLSALVLKAGLPLLRDAHGLAVRDPAGHVFEFLEPN